MVGMKQKIKIPYLAEWSNVLKKKKVLREKDSKVKLKNFTKKVKEKFRNRWFGSEKPLLSLTENFRTDVPAMILRRDGFKNEFILPAEASRETQKPKQLWNKNLFVSSPVEQERIEICYLGAGKGEPKIKKRKKHLKRKNSCYTSN